eukprot:CAMPEP_0172638104 /NCGR_PEP_ID=MMETSP1068-20121228/212278_1 /TAXON_ID=35684 /ORGANISM="Pseudopedinella elastica, Strain CCMP716" /LENGTH=40 /DNA_ID= /DNA_START= /DNA_END= /DNA_ORIENTATION=
MTTVRPMSNGSISTCPMNSGETARGHGVPGPAPGLSSTEA